MSCRLQMNKSHRPGCCGARSSPGPRHPPLPGPAPGTEGASGSQRCSGMHGPPGNRSSHRTPCCRPGRCTSSGSPRARHCRHTDTDDQLQHSPSWQQQQLSGETGAVQGIKPRPRSEDCFWGCNALDMLQIMLLNQCPMANRCPAPSR